MIRRTSFAAALSAAVLVACGSVTDSVQFNVPAQFHSKASFGPFVQAWQTDDKRNLIMLMAIPGQVDTSKALDNAQVKDARIEKNERITICGNQPANFMQVVGTTGTTVHVSVGMGVDKTTQTKSNVEMLATHANGKTYFAMYAWPLNAKPDSQAEAALRGLCPK